MKSLKNHRGTETQKTKQSAVGGLLCGLCGSVFKNNLALIILLISFPLASPASEVEIPKVNLDFGEEAIKRGEDVFKTTCQTCHTLRYLGYEALMTPDSARDAFGKVPPDLSLMAKARGRGDEGARYIYSLLVSYNDTPEKNSVFPNTAMPPVLSREDKDFERKARDVAAYLFYVAEPGLEERKALGRYVLGYMIILTALLYLLNKRTWMGIDKKGK